MARFRDDVMLLEVTPAVVAAYEAVKAGGVPVGTSAKRSLRLMGLAEWDRRSRRWVCLWDGWCPVVGSLVAVRRPGFDDD